MGWEGRGGEGRGGEGRGGERRGGGDGRTSQKEREREGEGNCGLHAFALSLLTLAEGSRNWARRAVVRTLAECDSPAAMASFLRAQAVATMRDIADEEMWEGMTFKTLAHSMSHQAGSYAGYLQIMSRDKEWVDACVLHALGVRFNVDIAIWQETQEPALVGASMTKPGVAGDILSVAMVNDLHFWGVKRASKAQVEVQPEQGDMVYELMPAMRPRLGPSEESQIEHAGPIFVNMSRLYMPDDELAAELALCHGLKEWNPFDQPSADLASAIQGLSLVKYTRDLGSRCILRSQVIEEILYEEKHFDDLPGAALYQRAQYRMRENTPSLERRGSTFESMKAFITASGVPDETRLQEKLAEPCERGGIEHSCLDLWRENIGAVRNWRILWRSLPAALRQEALLRMCAASIALFKGSGDRGKWQPRAQSPEPRAQSTEPRAKPPEPTAHNREAPAQS